MADLAVDDVAEQSPGLAVELHQLHLFKKASDTSPHRSLPLDILF
jgi:hypothetical protein